MQNVPKKIEIINIVYNNIKLMQLKLYMYDYTIM